MKWLGNYQALDSPYLFIVTEMIIFINIQMFLILISSLRVFRGGHKGHKGVLRVVIRLGYQETTIV